MRALFLDRDGIINEVVMRGGFPESPRHVKELKIKEGVVEWVKEAKSLGFATILVTNQPDVSRGLLSRYQLQKMHQEIVKAMPLDRIEVCTSSNSGYYRRKPNPGMILQSAKKMNVDLSQSYFLGDLAKDLEAGKRAGVQTILLQTTYNRSIHGTGDFNCDSYDQILSILKAGAPCSLKNTCLKYLKLLGDSISMTFPA